MITDAQIRQALIDFLNNRINGCFTAKVVSVNFNNDTCEVIYNELNYEVMLKASSDSKRTGMVIYPKVGSFVFCVNDDNSKNRYAALMINEIDKIKLNFEGDFIINNGTNKGMVIAPKLVDRLNSLEKAFNKLLNKYNMHTHVTPAGTAVMTTDNAGTAIIETKLSDIENTKIKH